MAKRSRPSMSFAIINNLLTPNIKAIDFKISPQATITTTTWNNSEDGFSSMKHLEKCS